MGLGNRDRKNMVDLSIELGRKVQAGELTGEEAMREMANQSGAADVTVNDPDSGNNN